MLFSIHFVLKAEKLLKEQKIPHELSPIPRAIGSSCGMALEFPCAATEPIQALLDKADIDIISLYRRTSTDQFVSLE